MNTDISVSNINLLWASLVVSELVKNGLNTFFVSPGNRNAPLLAALADHPECVKTAVIDERAAAFCALGHARATGNAAVLVCTSGTAAANYYPAVIEAAHDYLPLVVLSADRPPERVWGNANQSIPQPGLFGRFVTNRLDLPCPSESGALEALLAALDYLSHCTRFCPEPVHINLPLDNPLAPVPAALSEQLVRAGQRHLGRPGPYTTYHPAKTVPADLAGVARTLASARRGLLVFGRLDRANDRDPCLTLAEHLQWPQLCDIASGLKWRSRQELRLPCVDHPAALQLLFEYAPDVILQLGSGLVSKAYYTRLLTSSTAQLIQVSSRRGLQDPACRVNLRITASPEAFVGRLPDVSAEPQDAAAKERLLEAVRALDRALDQATPEDELSFARIADLLIRAIPNQEALFLGNSLTIRVFDASRAEVMKTIDVVTQRGVSGIEGHLATSVGYARAARRRTTAVVGDIALLHDLNSLLLLAQSPIPVVLVVINNQGGRIFERLPAASFPNLLHPWMTTAHSLRFAPIARQFGLSAWSCETPAELTACYQQALDGLQSALLEVKLCSQTDLAAFRRRQEVRI